MQALEGDKKEEKERRKKDKERGKKGLKRHSSDEPRRPAEKKPYSPYMLSTGSGDVASQLDHEKEKKLRGEFVPEGSPGEGEGDEPPIEDITSKTNPTPHYNTT